MTDTSWGEGPFLGTNCESTFICMPTPASIIGDGRLGFVFSFLEVLSPDEKALIQTLTPSIRDYEHV